MCVLRIIFSNETRNSVFSDTMKNETGSTDGQQNFRMGFGSFVDRPMAPFINPLKKDNPCSATSPCDPTYTFLNNQKITENYATVEKALKSTTTSSNNDLPEDGLTAMIQSIQCGEIDWYSTNFKILIFSSDAPVKVAGDGIVAGLIEPNDGQCHMENTGDQSRYTKEREYDYPSIGRVLKVIREAEVAVILAVTKENHAFYSNFRDEINKIGKAELGTLSEDSDNVVDLIRNEYKKLIEHIKFQNENLPEELKLKVVSECVPGIDSDQPSCDGVQAEATVKFKVELEMQKGMA
jgi:integrin beta 1